MSPREYLGFLRRAWGLFRGARKTWRLPPRARLLIIDRNTAYPLDEIFAHHSPHIMDIRGESINLAVVVRALPKFRLGALAYLEAYIDAVAPVLVLSRADNNPMLWQLKRRRSVAYTVALVQNGWRLNIEFEMPDLLRPAGPHGPWRVDRVFSMGSTWAAQVHRRVPAAGVPAGSILVNMIPRPGPSVTGVALVSTFRPEYPRRGLDLGESLYQGLGAYMRRHQLHLNVAGFAGPDGRGGEVAFLSARLPDGLWSLRSRESRWSSYDTLMMAGTVIVDQSTLGYEALVLGKRVGFVGAMEWCRETHRFGKPLEFGEKGPFWTDDPSEAEIERILDYLLSVSDEQWEKDSGWIRDQLIVHDHGNTILKRYVEGVLAGKGDVLAEEAGGGRG
jgi:surface carbohydrate biosynthesis protein